LTIPDGILLLGENKYKIHIINNALQKFMGLKKGLAVEKFLSLKNSMIEQFRNKGVF
jgi:hypothetical protein